MGLDIALGLFVLFSAVRGWMRGFVVQAIRLSSLVVSAYAAVPVREQVRSYAADTFPAIRPELLNRILFWACAAVCYFLIVGVSSVVVGMSRRKNFGLEEPNRGDDFAGFGLGVVKGLIVSSFLVSSLHKYS